MDWEQARKELIRFLGSMCRVGKSVEGIDDDTNLIDAGIIDSLAVVQIILYLEQRHRIDFRISGADPVELASIAGILRTIGGARP